MSQAMIPHAQGTLTLQDIWLVLRRRFWVIVFSCVALSVLALAYCLLSTRYYQATSRLQVQKENSGALNLDSLTGAGVTGTDALESSVNLQTQASILQSETLALKVIQALDLEHTPEFEMAEVPPKGNGPALDASPRRRVHALKIFEKMLTVQAVAGTKLIDVSYSDRDPSRAAAVVNRLVQSLVDYTFQTRYDATSETSTWLTDQLADLRKQSEDLQGKVVAMQKQTGIFSTGDVDTQGKGQSYSSTLDQLQQLTASLSQARANRVLKGAIYEVVRTGDPEALSNLSGTTMANSSPGVANSLSLLQSLRGQESTTQEALSQARTEYGPQYPDLIQLEASLKAIQQSIRAEVARIAERAKSDYDIATITEQKTRAQYDSMRVAAGSLNDHNIDYVITHQEAEQSRSLYEDLLRKLKEAGILEGMHASNITVVDKARVPAVPAKPKRTIIMLGAMAAGLVLGCILAFVIEATDDNIRTSSNLEQLADVPVLAILPMGKGDSTEGGSEFETLDRPQDQYAEATRVLRLVLVTTSGGKPPQVIVVASATPAEGRNKVSHDLAIVLAQQGRRVLLVDADLRHTAASTGSTALELENREGLSTMLAREQTGDLIRPLKQMPQLDVLPAGLAPANPADLLDSEQMLHLLAAWRAKYDVILLDSAPVLPMVDMLSLARVADLVLLVVRSGKAQRQPVGDAIKLLKENTQTRLGLVLNGVGRRSNRYYEYAART